MNGTAATIIDLLTKFDQGVLSSGTVLEKWPITDAADSKILVEAYCALYRYDTDDDIRQKEPDYEKMQINVIKRILKTIIDEFGEKNGSAKEF